MKIVFIQSYPIYHSFSADEEWLDLENRDKWMPSICAQLEYDAELWVVGSNEKTFLKESINGQKLLIRVFKRSTNYSKTKKHYSKSMLEFAKAQNIDLCFIKGIDGGAGNYIIKKHLIPTKTPFIYVVGGEYKSRYIKHARAILYETDEQKNLIQQSLYPPFCSKLKQNKTNTQLLRLNKSIDLNLFKPLNQEKEFDVISVGRLIGYYKNYDAIIELGKHCRLTHIGGGPLLEKYQVEYPFIEWVGTVKNKELPRYLNSAKVFFHSSERDYFPRVIVEAAACGIPPIAFETAIKKDVIPDSIGFRLGKKNYISNMKKLLEDEQKLISLGENAREYATKHWGIESSRDCIEKLLISYKF